MGGGAAVSASVDGDPCGTACRQVPTAMATAAAAATAPVHRAALLLRAMRATARSIDAMAAARASSVGGAALTGGECRESTLAASRA